MKLALAIRLMRAFNALKQIEVCELTGLSKSMVCELEADRKNATIETLQLLCETFRVRVSTLIRFAEALEDGNVDGLPAEYHRLVLVHGPAIRKRKSA